MGLLKAAGLAFHGTVFAAKVGANLAVGALTGMTRTLETVAVLIKDVNRRDWDGAGAHAEEAFENAGRRFEASLNSVDRLVEEIEDCRNPKALLTDENAKRAAAAAGLALGAGVIGVGLIDCTSSTRRRPRKATAD